MSSSTPTFPQPARRNLLAPVLLAFLVLGIIIALVLRYTPYKTADLTITRTTVFPTHTSFAPMNTLVIGQGQSQDDLYVLAILRIDNRLRLPLFLKDFTADLVTADGRQISTSALEQDGLPTLYTVFPAIKPLASDPLLRESLIEPGQSAEGMVVLHFPITLDTWNRRRSATLNVDLYHQGQQSVLIEQGTEAAAPAAASLPAAQ